MVSVDTNPTWVERTIKNLENLKITKQVTFKDFRTFVPDRYDLMLDDGVGPLRLEFALKNWRYLDVGGFMVFHDTRRLQDMLNVCRIIETFYPQIETVEINKNKSNLTVLKKQEPLYFEDWGVLEGRTQAQLGY